MVYIIVELRSNERRDIFETNKFVDMDIEKNNVSSHKYKENGT